MKISKLILMATFALFANLAFADGMPEYFYQPDADESVLEAGIGYWDQADQNQTEIGVRGDFIHGLTESFALRLGLNYGIVDPDAGDTDYGFHNLRLDLIGNYNLGMMLLHYGIEGSITPDKTGNQFFTSSHFFNPYLGLSMGEDMRFGAKLTYQTINTTSPVFGDDYTAAVFAEMHTDSYLAGLALEYGQVSGIDDNLTANLYGRLYFGDKLTLLPKLMYTYQMEDRIDDSFGVEIAARFKF